jgi:O-antigen ligase
MRLFNRNFKISDEKQKLLWVYGASGLFILFCIALILKQHFWLPIAVPLALGMALMYIFALDKVLLFIVFLTPFAVNIQDFSLNVGVSLPTEPMLLAVLALGLMRLLFNCSFDKKVMRHPVTVAIIIYLFWMLLTSITSEMPIVSFKYLLAKLWFIIPFYFMGTQLFRDFKNIRRFNWLYIIPLIIVIGYTTFNHARNGFTEQSGHWVMTPFYNDHTAYGAILAFFLPVLAGFSFSKEFSSTSRWLSMLAFGVVALALFLSYSRAAWVSVTASLMVFLVVRFKIKFRYLFITFATLVALFFTFRWQIIDALEDNKQDSSQDFIEHIQSIANISSDASNLERINRWQSAIRLFNEKPFFGWGPGTYQFVYAPFQRSKEKTIISTNAGDLGAAHSEYLGPLAESGVLGMLTFLGIVIAVLYTGIQLYGRSRDPKIKVTALCVILGLVTFFVHGLLNNFSETDKASIPLWGYIAMVVALDLYHTHKGETSDSKNDEEAEASEKAIAE